MANFQEQATVCEKCGSAVWVIKKTDQPQICHFILSGSNSHPEHFKLVCYKCENDLDKDNQESGDFCPLNAHLLQWRLPSEDRLGWVRYVATHLVCYRCQKEDRSIAHNYYKERDNKYVPEWKFVSYYGITSWGKRGGGPWMEDILFCQDCYNKTDKEEWLKQIIGLVLVKEAGDEEPNPQVISALAREVREKFPDVVLMSGPWW